MIYFIILKYLTFNFLFYKYNLYFINSIIILFENQHWELKLPVNLI